MSDNNRARTLPDANVKYLIKQYARKREPLPEAQIKIRSPKNLPSLPEKPSLANYLTMMMFPIMSGAFGYIGSVALGTESSGVRVLLTAAPMFFVALITMSLQRYSYKQKVKTITAERDRLFNGYVADLQKIEQDLVQYGRQQQHILHGENPSLEELNRRVQQRMSVLWERRPNDNDFLALRVGTGEWPNTVKVQAPDGDPDDSRIVSAQRIAQKYLVIPDMPILVNLNRLGSVGVRGNRPTEALYLAFAMLSSLAVHHSPDEVHLYVFSHRPDAAALWQWVRWLPHTNILYSTGAKTRLSLSPSTDEAILVDHLSPLLRNRADRERRSADLYGQSQPHLILIFDRTTDLLTHKVVQMALNHNPDMRENELQVSAIFIDSVPRGVSAVVTLQGETLEYRETYAGQARPPVTQVNAELVDAKRMEQLARRMAPLRTEASLHKGAGGLPGSLRLVQLFNAIQPDKVDLSRLYQATYNPKQIMSFPIGLNTDLKPQYVVLREKGQDGFGTHAMLAGGTGSGKSVTLQTLVLSMALTHSPRYLNMVLADFKGGASELAKVKTLPHVVGFVTDLNRSLVERFRIALESEIAYRQKLFDTAKDRIGVAVAGIYHYNTLKMVEPLPHLVVVIDEFAKALAINPEFQRAIDLIASQGRALGVHLILSTQRGTDFGPKIRPNIDIRMCLKVNGRDDSMAIFGRPEAFTELQRPGQGYIQVGDNEIFEMFQAGRVDLPYQPDGQVVAAANEDFVINRVGPDGRRQELYKHNAGKQPKVQAVNTQSEAEKLVEHIQTYCQQHNYPSVRMICLPPLPGADDLDLQRLIIQQPVYRSWQGRGWSEIKQPERRLCVAMGLSDLPAQQAQNPLVVDLKTGDGNFLVVGPKDSGKSLFLRRLVLGLALTHRPDEVQVYILARGNSLQSLGELPHCEPAIFASDTERIQRLLSFLRQEIQQRERRLIEARVDSLETLRRQQPDLVLPALIVIFEDFPGFKGDFEDKLTEVQSLIADGKKGDVHFILGGNSLAGIHTRIQEHVRQRLALGLKSAMENMEVLGRKLEAVEPISGRGYVTVGTELFECQVATAPDTNHLAKRMNEMWSGARPRSVDPLPFHLFLPELWHKAGHEEVDYMATAPIGRTYDTLELVRLNLFDLEPFFIVSGPPGGGKTQALITLCLAAAMTIPPERLEMVVLSFKRGLRGIRHLPQVRYAEQASTAKKLLEEIYEALDTKAKALENASEEILPTTNDLTKALPKKTLIVVDGLMNLMNQAELVKVLDNCAERGRNLHLTIVLADTGTNLGQVKTQTVFSMSKVLKSAFNYNCGLVFSAEAADMTPLNNLHMRMSQQLLRFHKPTLGKGRGVLVYQNQEVVMQVASIMSITGEPEKTHLEPLIHQIERTFSPPPVSQEEADAHSTHGN
ncbi:MAG: hypothetical protein KA314_22635 [Chloroflexi bacterium]|nr:hypothetical protein [Chloroflexota bacterium]MBP8058641.1 hypothetical protein [Chloroflexota bacterium]